jgi:hypothetical protein
MSLRRIKISRPGFFILSNPNSLSPKKKREHNNAWRQRQHDTKNDRLNCSHRSPRSFDSANLLLARSACIVGFLHVNRNARPPGLVRSRSNAAVSVWNAGLVFLVSHRPIAIETLPGSMPSPICHRRLFQPVLFAAFVVISISMGITGAVTAETLKLYGLGLPFLLAGLWSGFKLYGKIDDEMFRKAVYFFCSPACR